MENSRTINTIRNINAGLINRLVSIFLPFINRTVLLWVLGAEFTGLTSLCASILSVLNVAELGFSTAIVYSLYGPMARHDEEKICEIVSMFKKVYQKIGTVIFVAGLLIMFFLNCFINGTVPESANIYVIYFLYLVNSSISYYLFAYKECMLIADQRNDVVDNIRTIFNIIVYLLQFVILIITHDFYLYLIIMIIGTILTSITVNYQTKKRYPFYSEIKSNIKIPKSIKKKVHALMIDRICDTFRNSFDSVIISSFLGLTATAIYNNYFYVYSALYSILLVICTAMAASVGNSIIERNEKDNYDNLLMFSQIFALILGWTTICLLCLYQPFMHLWVGENLLLSNFNMILFCIYFYLINMNNIRNQYISGNGYWEKLKFSYIIEAVGNLILNFLLGKFFGITGILLATIITIFIFNYLQRNKILFDNYFKNESIGLFYREQFYYAFVTVVSAIFTYFICKMISFTGIVHIILIILILTFVSSMMLILGFSFTSRFKQSKQFIIDNFLFKFIGGK